MSDDFDEVAQLFAHTVDELRIADDADSAMAALHELWERVEDPAMLREAVKDAGGAWADLLPMFGEGGDA
jgi:hypothetical protein